MTRVIITKNELEDDRRYVTGHFYDFPGWMFAAFIRPELSCDGDCWICGLPTLVTSVSFYREGEIYYTCPDDDCDPDPVDVTADVEEMGRILGQFLRKPSFIAIPNGA